MDVSAGHAGNADQIVYWNGRVGRHWTDRQELQDQLLTPVLDVLIDRVGAEPGDQIIDVGCGCGATSLALATQVTPSGHVLGIDISAPMLDRARQLAPVGSPVEWILADATVFPFKPASANFLVSRFGVMFFADPALSFSNMRRALRPKGRLVFVCWREPRDNPWMMVPLQAAYQHVPKMPQLGPEDPGPFAFASEERVQRILSEAGFTDIAMERCDLVLDAGLGRGLDAAVESSLEIGPSSRALEGHPAEVRAAAAKSIREALAPFSRGKQVLIGAAIWIVTAEAPA